MIEQLESRIAPASVFTVTDLNGDLIKFTSSKGTLSSSNIAPYMSAPDGVHSVYAVVLDDPQFEGTNLTVTVIKHGDGDGNAIIGLFSAAGRHLGKVSIGTDVGKIVAGSAGFTDNAIKSLTVGSIGRFGVFGNGGADSNHSTFNGGVGAMTIKGDYNGALFEVLGKLASLTIGGSVIGGGAGGQGQISADTIGKVVVKGDLHGGGGDYTGTILSGKDIASIKVLGSVIGGKGNNSGNIFFAYSQAATVGTILIAGSLIGGGGNNSGCITANGDALTVGSVTIGHDLVGGSGSGSGFIYIPNGTLDHLTVRGSVVGGTAGSGGLFVSDAIKTVVIAGDVRGGSNGSTGHIEAGTFDSVTIGGSLVGGSNGADGSVAADDHLGKITVRGSVVGGAGFDSGGISSYDNIATVVIGGSVIGGSTSGSGTIRTLHGAIGSVAIAHDLRGGAGSFSGSIDAATDLLKVTIGGSVYGGKGDNSGDVFAAAVGAGKMDTISIAGSLIGGSGIGSGTVSNRLANDNAIGNLVVGTVTIGHDVVGGSGVKSGAVDQAGTGSLGKLTVKGSLYGGTVDYAGRLSIEGLVGTILVSGSVYGGTGSHAGQITGFGIESLTVTHSIYAGSGDHSGRVDVSNTLGNLRIGGDLRGGSANYTGSVHATSITKQSIGGLQAFGTGVESGQIIG